ncbi:MAG: hypothetical protein JSS61_00670 [Verrucomicrobia bacterium]|nr:hypothetical protein [Verrucomicrobiota bacterium]
MTAPCDATPPPVWQSSMCGLVRTMGATLFVCPLQVIKTHQQLGGGRCDRVAASIWEKRGFRGFYAGAAPHLAKWAYREIWVWPMITIVPPSLDPCHVGPLAQQALTGLSIATIDTALAPLDRARILLSCNERLTFSDFFRRGWSGLGSQWRRQASHWASFLVFQKIFRDQEGSQPTLSQLTVAGIKTTLATSFIAAPFDAANTLRQMGIPRHQWRTLFRGLPISAFATGIHGVSGVVLIGLLERKS